MLRAIVAKDKVVEVALINGDALQIVHAILLEPIGGHLFDWAACPVLLQCFRAPIVVIAHHLLVFVFVREGSGHIRATCLALDQSAEEEMFIDAHFFNPVSVYRLGTGKDFFRHQGFMRSIIDLTEMLNFSNI